MPIYDITDPLNAIFRTTLNFAPLGDYAGTGVAATTEFVYMTGEFFVINQDFGSSGNTRLFVGQYRSINDTAGISPQVDIVQPVEGFVATEGSSLPLVINATDDIGVAGVSVMINGVIVENFSAPPYEFNFPVPFGASSIDVEVSAIDFGNNSNSAFRQYAVAPDLDVPTLVFTSPTESDEPLIQGDTVQVTVEVGDNVGISAFDLSQDATSLISESDLGIVFDDPINDVLEYTLPFTIPNGINSISFTASALDLSGNLGSTVEVFDVIPDPLTTAVGTIIDPEGLPFANVEVEILGLTTSTDVNGDFTLSSIPTVQGDIQVTASIMSGDMFFSGTSEALQPVRGGTTDFGTITVFSGGIPVPNGGFETGDFSGFTVAGEALVISNLGELAPPEGNFMAFISTGGNAVGNDVSTISIDNLTIPAGANFIAFTYNFLSNESQFTTSFQDRLLVTLADSNSSQTVEVARVSDSNQFAPNGTGFNIMTDFKEVFIDVSALAGSPDPCTLTIELQVEDTGDLVVDSAALIDNIRYEFTVENP